MERPRFARQEKGVRLGYFHITRASSSVYYRRSQANLTSFRLCEAVPANLIPGPHTGAIPTLYDCGWETIGQKYSAFEVASERWNEAAGGVLTAKQAPTGPAPPRRSVRVPDAMCPYCIHE